MEQFELFENVTESELIACRLVLICEYHLLCGEFRPQIEHWIMTGYWLK